jgi:hypothetical protein
MAAVKRSPSYPRVGLGKALELAQRVYENAYESPVDTDTVLRLMGFQGRTGPSATALASLKQYGLIAGRDQALRVTPLAVRILHPSSKEEEAEAINEAVSSPSFYIEMREQFGGRIPGDQVLKSYLIRNRGFNPNGADDFIKILRENRAFMEAPPVQERMEVEAQQYTASNPTGTRELEIRDAVSVTEARLPSGVGMDSTSSEFFRFRIAPNCTVEISFVGPVSRKAIEKTIQLLELVKDNYPENAIE